MKKFLCLIACAAVTIGFSACSTGNINSGGSGNSEFSSLASQSSSYFQENATGIAKYVPVPSFGKEVNTTSGDTYCSSYYSDVSEDNAKEYTQVLKSAGFTENPVERKATNYYYFQAENANGKMVVSTYSAGGLSLVVSNKI